MKIQIRRTPAIKNQPITVREKIIFSCKHCGNRYHSYHYFCPQCLGEVESSSSKSCVLQILSCPAENLQNAASLLQKLSGNAKFDFENALDLLPWICMRQSDPAILQTWKECLESEHLGVEILSGTPENKRKRRKQAAPLFDSNAPAPYYLPPSLIDQIRSSADSVLSPGAKLAWAETVRDAFKILERLYKNASDRLLFYDYIFQVEEQIRDFVFRLSSSKWNEQNFVKRYEKLRENFGRMDSEIEAVHDQVQDQL
jgi:hypothetical protein